MKTNNFILLAALLGLVACGNNGGGSGDADSTRAVSKELVEATPGTYYSVLRPVNFRSNGFFPYGAATIVVKGDEIQVNTSMDDDQPVPHRQTVHIGTRCPSVEADDTNGDGFVDYDEAMRVVGGALMPLDGDLNSQSSGAEIYPRGRAMTYQKSASLSKVNSDLWRKDENPSANFVKLQEGQGIGFEGRVVLIHGTSQGSLPASVASYNGEPAHISLPVVCGVLKKISE